MNKETPSSDQKTENVSFGFREVPRQERQGLVNDVFHSVASQYDVMNDLMSAGMHRLWKQDLITQLHAPKNDQPFALLDVAGGTGDIALRYADQSGPNTTAIVCDINEDMLSVAKDRISKVGLESRITTLQGNAETLPVADRTFNAYTIAFGIRNVTDIDSALKEAYRALKIGGHFLCLEFSHVEMPLLDRFYDFHSFEVIPRIGKLVTGDGDPYQYLVESIRKFPKQADFAKRIEAAGFERVSYQNLTGGIAAIHSGWKL